MSTSARARRASSPHAVARRPVPREHHHDPGRYESAYDDAYYDAPRAVPPTLLARQRHRQPPIQQPPHYDVPAEYDELALVSATARVSHRAERAMRGTASGASSPASGARTPRRRRPLPPPTGFELEDQPSSPPSAPTPRMPHTPRSYARSHLAYAPGPGPAPASHPPPSSRSSHRSHSAYEDQLPISAQPDDRDPLELQGRLRYQRAALANGGTATPSRVLFDFDDSDPEHSDPIPSAPAPRNQATRGQPLTLPLQPAPIHPDLTSRQPLDPRSDSAPDFALPVSEVTEEGERKKKKKKKSKTPLEVEPDGGPSTPGDKKKKKKKKSFSRATSPTEGDDVGADTPKAHKKKKKRAVVEQGKELRPNGLMSPSTPEGTSWP